MDLTVIIGTILRHGGTALGAYLVSKGYIDESTATSIIESAVGFFIVVGSAIWSYVRTKNLKAK